MMKKSPLEAHLDELERQVLQRVRTARAAGSAHEQALLSAVRRRIATLPLGGLPPIEIPRVPRGAADSVGPGASAPSAWTEGSGSALKASVMKPAALIPMKPLLTLSQIKLIAAGVVAAGTSVFVPLLGSDGSRPESAEQAPRSTVAGDARPEVPVEAIRASDAPSPNARENVRPGALRRSHAGRLGASGLASPSEEALSERHGASPGISKPSGATQRNATKSQPVIDEARSSDSSRMTEDLSRLREAQKALQAGIPSKALELVSQIAEGPGRAALGPELQLTQVLALCALGDSASATRVASALGPSSARSIYAARLKSTCVGEAYQSDP